jgi:hypothetical protein
MKGYFLLLKERLGMARFQDRYAKNWMLIQRQTMTITNRKCCYCLNRQADEVHHVQYVDFFGAIAGREKPGIHVFPLCNACHYGVAHSRKYWVKDWAHPVFGNHNKTELVRVLRRGYLKLSGQAGNLPQLNLALSIVAGLIIGILTRSMVFAVLIAILTWFFGK